VLLAQQMLGTDAYAGVPFALLTLGSAGAALFTMVFTTFGAVAGPNLVGVMGDFALSIGVPALAGPFILGAAAYLLAGVVLFILLRPEVIWSRS
jgi:hypothetical protein